MSKKEGISIGMKDVEEDFKGQVVEVPSASMIEV